MVERAVDVRFRLGDVLEVIKKLVPFERSGSEDDILPNFRELTEYGCP
jgi:hypothetical protein